MDSIKNWQFWGVEQVAGRLEKYIQLLDANLEVFPPEYREKNRGLIRSLVERPVTSEQVREGSRYSDLIPLAFAFDFFGRETARMGYLQESLDFLEVAHEIFRSTNGSLRPSKNMRQVLKDALRIMFDFKINKAVNSESDAGIIRDELRKFVVSTWGSLPSRLALEIDEMILVGFEYKRREQEDDSHFHERFVRDNIEAILSLEIPLRLEKVRRRWEEIGEHVVPNATRLATLAVQRPQDLSQLLAEEAWSGMRQAVEQGNVESLVGILDEVEEDLEGNLKLRLDAKPEFRIPSSDLRFRGGPDKFFLEAREFLMRQDARALGKFNNIHYNKSANHIAKEWYAYALSVFGTAADIHEIIQLLEDAVGSERFREDINWSARWNLACALRRLPNRANEALDCLLPVLENDIHTSEVSELCLLWAIEQGRSAVLASLLLKSPYYEAHLLAALYDIEGASETEYTTFHEHFRRIGRILRDPSRLFPEPKERVSLNELDDLTRGFIETSLVDAGIEWFRQRLAYEQERQNFKNWECAARLNEESGNIHAAWRCRQEAWWVSKRNPRLEKRKKTGILKSLLNWGLRNGFESESAAVLRSSWRETTLTEGEFRLWEQRLVGISGHEVAVVKNDASEKEHQVVDDQEGSDEPTPLAVEQTIQQIAGSFSNISRAESLAEKIEDAERLLQAVKIKNPELSASAVSSIRSLFGLATKFQGSVPEEDAEGWLSQVKENLATLRRERSTLPFELSGLAQACERVVQNFAVRARALPDLVITPPSDLRAIYGQPGFGGCPEDYATRLFARLYNPGPEEMTEIQVSFISTSSGIDLSPDPIMTPPLAAGERRVVDCPMKIFGEVTETIMIRIHANYSAGGFVRGCHATCSIPIHPLQRLVLSRYITSGPVSVDRSDLFHGRERELLVLSGNFSSGRMLKLYFVNGIRAVGKSTLMQHLGSRCSPDTLPLLLDVETALGSSGMNAQQLVRQLCRLALREAQKAIKETALTVDLPGHESFQLDPPWVVFDSFLDSLRLAMRREKILLCFDELQRLVKRIADPDDPMDDGFLGWLRDKIQAVSSTFVVCTASESFGMMRRRYEDHTLWRNMEPFDISFVDRSAMESIATMPVKSDGVYWLSEALDRLWDFTEGHPAVTQILAEGATRVLSDEYRRVVLPQDVERAVEDVPADATALEVWWNEKEGMITATHRQIAFLILQHQSSSRAGILEERLAELGQKAGIRMLGRYLEEMSSLEVLTPVPEGDSQKWKIRGAFLERHLTIKLMRALQDSSPIRLKGAVSRPTALMLDLENVKIGLADIIKQMPSAKSEQLRPRLDAADLATRLLEAAAQHGTIRQRWAVADWDKPFFRGDQKAFKAARYSTDIAGNDKSNSSDHVLREKIHFILREHPEVETFIIGTGDADFHETIKTLQEKGKSVVLWSTRDSINRVYGESLRGPDRIRIEWLEDIVLGGQSSMT